MSVAVIKIETEVCSVTEQESTIQLFAAATCPSLYILLQQIAESFLLAQ